MKNIQYTILKHWAGNLFTAIVLILSTGSLQAQFSSSGLSFDIFTQEDGLPNNQIQCIYQDSKGWMWIGTSQGVSRFDGYHFVNFLHDPYDSTSLTGHLVRVITEDKKGNLLIGTENGGLNVFDREKEQFSNPLKPIKDFALREVSVNAMAFDDSGNLFIGTEFNIIRLDTAGQIKQLTPEYVDTQESFNGSYIRNLQFDNNGILWIGTNKGLYTYDPVSNVAHYFQLPFKQEHNLEIWEIYIDDAGYVWAGTYASGLFRISAETHTIEVIKLEPEMDRTETVRSVSKGVFGEYWIGTRGGLYVYSLQKGVTGFLQQDSRDARSISNNSILSIFNDARGETWIGTRNGLNLLAKSKQVFHHFGALPGDNKFLNSSIIYAFWMDDNENIWIGTEDGGVNIFNRVKGEYTYLTTDDDRPFRISQNCIKAFLDDKSGNLWIGTYLGGIDVLNLSTGTITNYKHEPGKPGSLSDNRVWDFCFDRNNNIWVATSGE